MKHSLQDSEKLESIIKALNLTPHSMSVKLGYKAPSSIYHVLNGVNSMSTGMEDRIIKVFPNVSVSYVKKGIEPIILTGDALKTQMNVMNTHTDPELAFFKKLIDLPARMDRLEETLRDFIERMGENK